MTMDELEKQKDNPMPEPRITVYIIGVDAMTGDELLKFLGDHVGESFLVTVAELDRSEYEALPDKEGRP
jgi:hypothetical protein